MPKKNIQAKFTLLCDYALISQDNKISIIGEFDRLYSTAEKASLSKWFLVSKLTAEPNLKLDLEISVNNEQGTDQLIKRDFQITTDPEGRAGLIVEFGGLVFNKFGTYKATITSNKEIISEAEIQVIKVNAPKVAQA